MFFKLPFAVSFSVLFITIQYAVFRKSSRTFYVSLYIYIANEKCSVVSSTRKYVESPRVATHFQQITEYIILNEKCPNGTNRSIVKQALIRE